MSAPVFFACFFPGPWYNTVSPVAVEVLSKFSIEWLRFQMWGGGMGSEERRLQQMTFRFTFCVSLLH